MVEPVAGLRLEGRRARLAHPAHVPASAVGELGRARCSRRPDRREDPAAARRAAPRTTRPRRAQRELLDAVAGEARVRVAVDEPGDRRQARVRRSPRRRRRRREVAHAPDLDDAPVLAEDVRVLDHRRRRAARRRAAARRARPARRPARGRGSGVAGKLTARIAATAGRAPYSPRGGERLVVARVGVRTTPMPGSVVSTRSSRSAARRSRRRRRPSRHGSSCRCRPRRRGGRSPTSRPRRRSRARSGSASPRSRRSRPASPPSRGRARRPSLHRGGRARSRPAPTPRPSARAR